MKKFIFAIVLFVLAASILAVPAGPVPRKAPELSFQDLSGKTISLSSFKGKVVVVEFLFIRSMHCVRVAQTLNKLNDELGPRGFQALGVAFTAPGAEADAATVENLVQSFRFTFPIGYTDKENVDRFLERDKNDILNIPQMVVIDRAGTIRAQSGNRPGDPKLENSDSLRLQLNALLNESPSTPSGKPAAPQKTTRGSL